MASKTASFYMLVVAVMFVVAAAKLELEGEGNFGEWGYSIVKPYKPSFKKNSTQRKPFHANLH